MSRVSEPTPPLDLPADCAATTHVLYWIPAFLVKGRRRKGFWALQTRANYEAGTPDATYGSLDAAEAATPGFLAAWISRQVGHPVVLEPGSEDVRRARRGSRWHEVPVYFAAPADVQDPAVSR